jgi:hypothetical protein
MTIISIRMNDEGVVYYAAVLDDGQSFKSSVRPGQNLDGLHSDVSSYCTENWTDDHINNFMETGQ